MFSIKARKPFLKLFSTKMKIKSVIVSFKVFLFLTLLKLGKSATQLTDAEINQVKKYKCNVNQTSGVGFNVIPFFET